MEFECTMLSRTSNTYNKPKSYFTLRSLNSLTPKLPFSMKLEKTVLSLSDSSLYIAKHGCHTVVGIFKQKSGRDIMTASRSHFSIRRRIFRNDLGILSILYFEFLWLLTLRKIRGRLLLLKWGKNTFKRNIDPQKKMIVTDTFNNFWVICQRK